MFNLLSENLNFENEWNTEILKIENFCFTDE